MNRVYTLIEQLISYINENKSKFSTTAERAYKSAQIDLPVKDCVATFCCEDYSYKRVYNEDTKTTTVSEQLTVNMSCYVSFNNSALSAQQVSGDILSGIKDKFSSVTGYNLGKIETDDAVRAFKVQSMINFSF